ncbi:hypothetical protein [Nocardioides pinisoli]|uniref:DUF732 domain-containing protein n=1 Tax=Nocardioides pinisoli TaxID=2950279 RepID=A0ABT1KR40_9ACTN|nr:hypothetical protein [Nocardioides pinisoli]MCP3420210.1 hypothetical protein [Nocardioides pinisoli]
MRSALVVACSVVLAGCGGPGADAPRDASIEDFCAAKSWMVSEGMDRFLADGLPSDDELVVLVHDWGAELARVGTPDNMSADARQGFEKLVARLEDLEANDVESGDFNWEDGDWENEEEKSFARYVTNTCP